MFGNSGHVGILPSYANLVIWIEVDVLRLKTQDEWPFFVVNKGFASVQRKDVLVLVGLTSDHLDIDREEAEQDLKSVLSAFGQENVLLKTRL